MKQQLPDRIRAWASLLAGGEADRLYFFDDEGDQVVLDDSVDSFGEAVKVSESQNLKTLGFSKENQK